jgi:hypothetical protein
MKQLIVTCMHETDAKWHSCKSVLTLYFDKIALLLANQNQVIFSWILLVYGIIIYDTFECNLDKIYAWI